MLGGQRHPVVAVALGEPGVLDQPGGAGLDGAVRLLPARRAVGQPDVAPASSERVGEERPRRSRCRGRRRSSTMPLPRRSAEHRLAHLRQRRPRADLDAEGAGQLGVAHRRGEVAEPQLEGHVEHDVPVRVLLEPAGAVAEAAVGGGEGALHPVHAVPAAHRGDGVGDLLAVGADVLHRGRPDAAGDARRAPPRRPSPRPTARSTNGSHGSPAATVTIAPPHRSCRRGRRRGSRRARRCRRSPCVGDHEVAAARDEQHRRAGLVRATYGGQQLVLGGRAHELAGGTTQPQGGQAGQVRHPGLPSACRAPSGPRR